MSDLEIQCPQPIRPLKRKASQLIDTSDDTSGEQIPCKRQNHSSLSINSSIHNWLEDLPISLNRSRSDSYLDLTHDNSQHRQIRSSIIPRSMTSLPIAKVMPFNQPMSSQSRRETTTLAPVPPDTPSQSFTPLSHPSFSESKNDWNKSNRVQSPTYRDELQNHYVYIDSYATSIPEPVHTFAQNLLQKKRTSPSLNQDELSTIRAELSELATADEVTTRQGFDATKIFPTRKCYKNKIAIGGNVPFDRTALPFTPGLNLPPIVTPKPDLQYGYLRDAFDPTQAAVMRHGRLGPVAHPNTATYWPFFVVEFKSASRGGSRWVAENQNAGTGSLCVNSIKTLLNYTRSQDLHRQMIDSIAFSCAADADFGSLWVHWQDKGNDGPARFVSSEVDSFSFKKPKDLCDFRTSVRNIIDYGIDKRLPMIKEALADILPLIPQWDAEDKAAKTRRRGSSQINDEDTGVG